MRFVVSGLILLGVALFLLLSLAPAPATELPIREGVVASGVRDTSAQNLVSAIYLGYRAFDTVGETIVLLLAVAGVVFLIREES